jgi:hypothetical protein
MSPKGGGKVEGFQPISTTWSPTNFGDLTPYLTYGTGLLNNKVSFSFFECLLPPLIRFFVSKRPKFQRAGNTAPCELDSMQLKRLIITPYPAKPLLGSRVRGSSRAVFEAHGGSTRKGDAWEGPNNISVL